jgi:hypothetical protein
MDEWEYKLERMHGQYDWVEAVRQSMDQRLDDLPPEAAGQLGPELAQEVEDYLTGAHLDPGGDLG